jgi:NAD(P)H-flavin reductase
VGSENNNGGNPLVPMPGKIIKIVEESPDVKTFHIATEQGKPFTPKPGQLGMLSLPGVGEAMFSITNQGDDNIQMAIKRVGVFTEAIHDASVGQPVTIRGPYGNCFPLDKFKGKDILFIGGGIGLAPVRSMIGYSMKNREDFGKITILYGGRSPEELVFKEDLFENWPKAKDTTVYVTVDKGDDDWKGHVGFVPAYVQELSFSPESPQIVLLCGPPVMIKFTLQTLSKLGYKDDQIVTTLEMRMKCGIGKCGRCNIGSKFICLDGPVFTLEELQDLPPEW